MSTYITEIRRKSDGVVSAALMVDDYFGNHNYAMFIPKGKYFPLTREELHTRVFEKNGWLKVYGEDIDFTIYDIRKKYWSRYYEEV